MTPLNHGHAQSGRTIISNVWKYLFFQLALPSAAVNVVINLLIGFAIFRGNAEIWTLSGTQPLFPDVVISTFNSVFITHLVALRISSKTLVFVNPGFPSDRNGLAMFFSSGSSLLHRIRGGIVLALMWAVTAAAATFAAFTALDVQKMAFADVMTLKGMIAFAVGYLQSVISGYANARGQLYACATEYQ